MPHDDARLLREVKGAQERYESVRRAHLPREFAPASHRCDAHIGRFCYWYDSTESAPAPEPPPIIAARERLLAFLDSAVALHPATAWLVGQRVRYLIEAKRYAEAVNASRRCGAEPWWCAALGGLALHTATNYREADSAFTRALAASTPEQRCAWFDLRPIVPAALGRAFRDATCARREELAARIWAVSKPLWMSPGNDLETEHFARLTMAAIFARTANAYGVNWGSDSREMMVRYGWSEWFTRDDGSEFMTMERPRITGHDREPSYSFFPNAASFAALRRIDSGAWRLREAVANSRYSPRHIERLSSLPHQLARFPHGDSTLLVARLSAADSAMRGDTIVGFLGLLRDTTVMGVTDGETLHMIVPRDTVIVSVEAMGQSSRHAARARYAVAPLETRDGWALSDALLYIGSPGAPTRDLDSALARAIIEPVARGTPIGVFWMLAARNAAPIRISVAVQPIRVNVMRRLAIRMHLAPDVSPVRMQWEAVAPMRAAPESVVLRLPESARGAYRVVLTVAMPDGSTLEASRELAVR